MKPNTVKLIRTLLWKDWKNWVGLAFGYFLLVTLTHPVALLQAIKKAHKYDSESILPYVAPVIQRLQFGSEFYFVAVMVMSVVLLGSLLVGEERKRNTYNLLLAMPFSRKQILLSKVVFGIGTIVASYLLNGLLLAAIVASNPELAQVLNANAISNWVAAQTIIMVTILSFTFVFATMTGTTAASSVLTAIFLIFPAGFVELVYMNFGYSMKWLRPGNPLAQVRTFSHDISLFLYAMGREMTLVRWPWLLGASVLMIALALRTFEGNPMEKNGEVLIIESVKPLFRIGVPLCFILFIGGFFGESLGTVMGYAVGAVVGGLITHYTIGFRRAVPAGARVGPRLF